MPIEQDARARLHDLAGAVRDRIREIQPRLFVSMDRRVDGDEVSYRIEGWSDSAKQRWADIAVVLTPIASQALVSVSVERGSGDPLLPESAVAIGAEESTDELGIKAEELIESLAVVADSLKHPFWVDDEMAQWVARSIASSLNSEPDSVNASPVPREEGAYCVAVATKGARFEVHVREWPSGGQTPWTTFVQVTTVTGDGDQILGPLIVRPDESAEDLPGSVLLREGVEVVRRAIANQSQSRM